MMAVGAQVKSRVTAPPGHHSGVEKSPRHLVSQSPVHDQVRCLCGQMRSLRERQGTIVTPGWMVQVQS
jgi:hypothetical protein